MYEPGFRMKPARGAEALVRVVEPYFEREFSGWSGHDYTPPARLSPYAAVVKADRVVSFSVPLLEAYGLHAPPNYRVLLGNCIDLLLPTPLVRVQGPSFLETTVMRKGASTIVHLLSFCPERRALGMDVVEDAVPLVDVPVEVTIDRAPRTVTLEPEGRRLSWRYVDGYALLVVSMTGGHGMIVIR
jgi:hypothetical protein